jgi:hypothetical protein
MKRAILLSFIISLLVVGFGRNIYYVGPDKEYASPAEAVEVSSDGDSIFIYEGAYSENIEIYKSLNINGVGKVLLEKKDEKKPLIRIKGEVEVQIDNVSFEAESIILKSTGAELTITGCEFRTTSIGLSINGGDVNIEKTIFEGLSNDLKADDTFNGNGIFCMYSDNVSIDDCTFIDSGTGIYSYEITNLKIHDSSMVNNLTGAFLVGIENGVIENNRFESNTVGIELAADSTVELNYNSFLKSLRYDVVLSEPDCTICENCGTDPFTGELHAEGNTSDRKLFCPDCDILRALFEESEGG